MRVPHARWRSTRRGITGLLLGLFAITACTSATPDRYRSLREEWRDSRPLAPPAALDDALFEGVSALDRAALVRHVLDRNPNIAASRYAWRAALERYPQVTALDDPMLGVGLAPLSIGSHRVNDAPKFDLSQKLPFPGKLRLRGEAVLAEAEAAAHDLAAVRLRLATMASLLYDDYALVARSLEINASHIALLEEFQQIAIARYEAGEASAQDPLQAEVERTHAQHRAIVLESAQRVTADQINALLHRRPRSFVPPVRSRLDPPAEPSSEASPLIELALADRPERAAAAARVHAEETKVDLARREFMPDFTLVGSYNEVWQEEDLQPFVGVQLNIPLQLGRRRAAVREAKARLEGARHQQLAVEDDVRLAVQMGFERLREARHVEHLVRDRLLPAARDQVDAARAGFESGRNGFLTLIDAQRNLLDTELGHEEALANLGRRRAELDRAMGRLPGVSW